MNLPETKRFPRRPVYERFLRRKHHMPLKPPSEAEIRDAHRILDGSWEDDLTDEARRILSEADVADAEPT